MALQARRRKSYEARSKSNTLAAKTLADAFCREIEYETIDGERVRKWRADELRSFTNDQVAQALRGRRAHERHELLNEIPPPAIKDAMTRGWLREIQGLFWVTEKAATDLKLPRKSWDGAAIKFLKVA